MRRFVWLYDDYGSWKIQYVIAACLVIVAVFMMGVGAVSNLVSSGQCAAIGQRYGLQSHWTMFYGCFLKLPDGHWILTGQYNAFQGVNR